MRWARPRSFLIAALPGSSASAWRSRATARSTAPAFSAARPWPRSRAAGPGLAAGRGRVAARAPAVCGGGGAAADGPAGAVRARRRRRRGAAAGDQDGLPGNDRGRHRDIVVARKRVEQHRIAERPLRRPSTGSRPRAACSCSFRAPSSTRGSVSICGEQLPGDAVAGLAAQHRHQLPARGRGVAAVEIGDRVARPAAAPVAALRRAPRRRRRPRCTVPQPARARPSSRGAANGREQVRTASNACIMPTSCLSWSGARRAARAARATLDRERFQ